MEAIEKKYLLYKACSIVIKELDKANQLSFFECSALTNGVSTEEVFVELETSKAAERHNGGLRRSSDTHRITISHHYEDLVEDCLLKMPIDEKPRNPIGFTS